jgi:hypothetical protein
VPQWLLKLKVTLMLGKRHNEREERYSDKWMTWILEIGMTLVVKVANGCIEEIVNGKLRRPHGANIIDVATDGAIVAAVMSSGRVVEYQDGKPLKNYGSKARRVAVAGGLVAVTLDDGRIRHYENGNCLRSAYAA